MTSSDIQREKELAAREAVKLVKDGNAVGLGTGSTTEFFIRELGKRIEEGLKVRCIASSVRTAELARSLGIEIAGDEGMPLDIDVDGADEIDHYGRMIKGGGGALLRERLVASSSRNVIIIVDHTKYVERIGKFPLPVEISPFMFGNTLARIRGICADSRLRNGGNYRTDNGNMVVDCNFRSMDDPESLLTKLRILPGVMEVGIFLGLCSTVIIGRDDKVEILNFEKR